jgi:4-diphosphocytidyl-2-C-methyl-D-erythritol kinase
MSADELTPVVRLAPAKVNLTLSVGGRRRDGYHDLHSVMVPLGLADRLSLARAAAGGDALHVVGGPDGRTRLDAGPFGSVQAGIDAARRIVGRGAEAFPIATRLEKRIPVAGGLAGGSSDAAAAIDGALAAWGADVPAEDRHRAAASVGSDVPFFLAGGPALVEGRGERVTPLRSFVGTPPAVVLVTPAVQVSTAAAFKLFDEEPAARPGSRGSTRLSSEHLAAELGPAYPPMPAVDLVRRAGVLAAANDLANAADLLVPGLRGLRRALVRLLGVPIGLSGSGPTLWALYPSLEAADEAARRVRDEHESGMLTSPGAGTPFVAAASIEGGAGRTSA